MWLWRRERPVLYWREAPIGNVTRVESKSHKPLGASWRAFVPFVFRLTLGRAKARRLLMFSNQSLGVCHL